MVLAQAERRLAIGKKLAAVIADPRDPLRPGVHTFTQFGRKTDGRYGIMPGGATAFLCTRGHMLPFLLTFILYRPSGDLQSPRRKAAVIPALPGAYAL